MEAKAKAKAKAKAVADGMVAAKVILARANTPAKENGVTKSNLGHHLRVMVKATGKAVFSLGLKTDVNLKSIRGLPGVGLRNNSGFS